jgi:hypothetical protein
MLAGFVTAALDKEVAMATKKTVRKNDVSPEVAERLAELAGEMRALVYGQQAFPEWGTKFAEIESQGMNIGLEFARLFMEQSVDQQAQQVPADALDCDGEAAQPTGQRESTLETPAGEVNWEQPKTRLKNARRDFFPSGEGAGH